MNNLLLISAYTELEIITEYYPPTNQENPLQEKGLFDGVPLELVGVHDDWHDLALSFHINEGCNENATSNHDVRDRLEERAMSGAQYGQF